MISSRFCILLSIGLLLSGLVQGRALYYDLDIHPVFEKYSKKLSDDPEISQKLSEAKLFATYMSAASYKVNKNISLKTCIKTAIFCCGLEWYTVEKYGLYEEYRKYLLSPQFIQAQNTIAQQNRENPLKTSDQILSRIRHYFQQAMTAYSPRLNNFYTSAHYSEARLRLFSYSNDSLTQISQNQATEDLLFLFLILARRWEEIVLKKNGDNLSAVLRTMKDDLTDYYRLYSGKCTQEVAAACRNHINAVRETADTMDQCPKNPSPENALGIVLLWTAAGGNPLEPAIIQAASQEKWKQKMQRSFENLTNSIHNLRTIGKKYL